MILGQVNGLLVKKQYEIENTNMFEALENLSVCEDINWAWWFIKEYIKTSAKQSVGVHELKRHKPWFDEECLGCLDQRKQDKINQVLDPSQSIVDNINNVRSESSRYLRKKKNM